MVPVTASGLFVAISLATSIDQTLTPLTQALDHLHQAAATVLAKREDAWRPHALALAEWLPKAQQAQDAAASLKNLKSDSPFFQSNVSLEDVHLGGSGKARKVEAWLYRNPGMTAGHAPVAGAND